LTVWTTRVSNTDRSPYFRGSASMRRRMLPWPLETRAPWLDFNPWARELQTPNAYKALTQELRVFNPRCYAPTLGCLATLYAQSRRQCYLDEVLPQLLAPLWSETPRQAPFSIWRPGHENASSNFRLLTNIPHCCLRWGYFKPQVAGRPLRPARDHRLETHS